MYMLQKFADGTARQLWEDLDNKYKSEDAGYKKFQVSQLFEYKMVNNKSVMAQVHELQFIMNQLISECRNLDETFQVSTIISKLLMTWKDCRKELKQKRDAMTMQELIEYLQIEENYRNLDNLKLEGNNQKALVIENASQPKGHKRKKNGSTNSSSKKFKSDKACWKCGKNGHFKKQCRVYLKEKEAKNQANLVQNEDIVAVISEVNMINDDVDWWVDSGATKHVARNKNLLETYEPVKDDYNLCMGNSSLAR
ncbi:uncharacterized protein LOC143878903 [Tasmannia lanceolata]|uniref:uncharacterized protein LOC143878903 n=1 Tax=Tasmannia lanceolata TaxID=3420 RepID=UPI004062E4D0